MSSLLKLPIHRMCRKTLCRCLVFVLAGKSRDIAHRHSHEVSLPEHNIAIIIMISRPNANCRVKIMIIRTSTSQFDTLFKPRSPVVKYGVGRNRLHLCAKFTLHSFSICLAYFLHLLIQMMQIFFYSNVNHCILEKWYL